MSTPSRSKPSFVNAAEQTAEAERTIQKRMDRKDAAKEKKGGKLQSAPMQAGARRCRRARWKTS